MVDPLKPYLERLRTGQVKITDNRLKVLRHFLKTEMPWTLRSLHLSLNEHASVNLSSIYRTLEALHSAGILEEFRLPGNRQTFYSLIKLNAAHGTRNTARADHHHHHIVCQDCGQVSHLDLCVPVGWMGKVENASGFRITEHHLEFKGLCSKCQ